MKSILIIVPYDEVYPPMNGGMQRCFNIIHQLAKYFELTLITNQSKETFLTATKEYPAIAGVQVYSTKDELPIKDVFSLLPGKLQNALRYRWYKKQYKGPADGLFLQYYPVLLKLLKRRKYDTIVLENLASLNAVSTIRRFDKAVKIVYDAHNVDSNLAAVAVEKWAMKKEHLHLINKEERELYKTVDAILTCSKEDLCDFVKMNHNKLPGVVIPNGVSVAGQLFDRGVHEDVPGYILFCGTLWSTPNSEGLLWFYQSIWPTIRKSFPQIKLLVVGSGKIPYSLQSLVNDASLQFTGAVEDVKPWYNKSAVAIVPLLSGSGTRLKILEAMALGLPVISTSKGAEGITYTNGSDIVIADSETGFAGAVISLLKSKEDRLAIQQAARKLIEEKYDWNIVGASLYTYLNTMN
ncbi:MAG: glycosyltransferase family 4 protein [Ferruginibacter sp.]